MSNPFSIKFPIFIMADDSDSYYTSLQTLEDNLIVDEGTKAHWIEKAGGKKIEDLGFC